MFKKLKLKFMGNLLNKFLAPLIQLFKAKSPKIFAGIAIVATVLQFGLATVVNFVIPGVTLPPEFLSLTWLIDVAGLPISHDVASTVLWFLALLTGSSSTAWLPKEKRDDVVTDSKLNAKEMDIVRTDMPEDLKAKEINSVRDQRKINREQKRALKKAR